jgi:uncharacterized membrane protein
LIDDGQMVDLGALAGTGSVANDIDACGRIVGSSGLRALLWSRASTGQACGESPKD